MHREPSRIATGWALGSFFVTAVGVSLCAPAASATVRVFVTPSSAGYGLTNPPNAFQPTFSTVDEYGDYNAYDFSSGAFVCTSFPPTDAPSGTCASPVVVGSSEFSYIWVQFQDEPAAEMITGLEITIRECGQSTPAAVTTCYYVQNNKNAAPPLDKKRWVGTATPPDYPEWHLNPQDIIAVHPFFAYGVVNEPNDPPPASNWNMYKQQGGSGSNRTGVCLIGAVSGTLDKTYEILITNIAYYSGPTPTVSGGAFTITTSGACCFPDGSCQIKSPAQCQQAGGWYRGDNSTCQPDTCALVLFYDSQSRFVHIEGSASSHPEPPEQPCYDTMDVTQSAFDFGPFVASVSDYVSCPWAGAEAAASQNSTLGVGSTHGIGGSSGSAGSDYYGWSDASSSSGLNVTFHVVAPCGVSITGQLTRASQYGWEGGAYVQFLVDYTIVYEVYADQEPTPVAFTDADLLAPGHTYELVIQAAGEASSPPYEYYDHTFDVTLSTIPYMADCNNNGIPDECDISCGPLGGPCDVPGCGQSADSNSNGIPDECEFGACCFVDGHCEYLDAPACGVAGGEHEGNGTSCMPNPCPQPGACCFGDGHCEMSSVTAPGDCAAGGTYMGDNTDCDSNPCTQPGGCCFEDGHCEMSAVIEPGNCAEGGTYLGDNTDCEPNPCWLAEGLVGYWQFDEGSGSVAHDSSGYGNDGAIYGGATWVEGVCGPALDFDGSSSYVQASTVNVDYLTVSALVWWDYFYPDNHGHAPISNANSGSPWSGYVLSGGSDPPYNYYQFPLGTTGSTQPVSITSTPLNTGLWYHIVVTYDGQWLKGYLDGQLVAETTASGTVRPATNPLLFGRPYYPSSPYTFNGTLDEVRIYNRALTAAEAWELYQSTVLGACCFVDGHCEYLDAVACGAAGGEHKGNCTSCMPNPCEQPPASACCYPDGSCAVTVEADCTAVWHPEWPDCIVAQCPQPGACCLTTEECQMRTEPSCTQDAGLYLGDGTACGGCANEPDLDHGESTTLNPGGGSGDPTQDALVTITNTGGPDDAWITVGETTSNPHPEAGGFSALGRTLVIETSLSAGQFFMTVQIPFAQADLPPETDPLTVDLTYFDAGTGNWVLAVDDNTQNSPGWPGPRGDRYPVSGDTPPQLSPDLGDYGVFWNPTQQVGFAWANVDHATDFAPGAAPPQADVACCFPNGMCEMLTAAECAAAGGTPGEYGSDCTPNECPPRHGDLNCDGLINFGDINPFVLLLSDPVAWQGAYPGCPLANGDINGDGTVNFGDINPFVSLLSGGG